MTYGQGTETVKQERTGSRGGWGVLLLLCRQRGGARVRPPRLAAAARRPEAVHARAAARRGHHAGVRDAAPSRPRSTLPAALPHSLSLSLPPTTSATPPTGSAPLAVPPPPAPPTSTSLLSRSLGSLSIELTVFLFVSHTYPGLITLSTPRETPSETHSTLEHAPIPRPHPPPSRNRLR
jgi:hypothetical protein